MPYGPQQGPVEQELLGEQVRVGEGRAVRLGIIQTLAFPYYDSAWNQSGSAKVRTGLSMAI
ncbi:hypothetical protein ABZ372_52935, partial [Streptomyces sp. NPDC005921]